MARKLPIGIQSFEKIRRDGFVYVDKTAYVYDLVRAGVPTFLSRPRRFGKSLLVSTMRAYFEGRRELFDGLDIEILEGNGPDSWVVRPVFHLDFNGADYTRLGGLENKLDELLRGLEELWGNDWDDLAPSSRFRKLLETAHCKTGHRVAVLVDEYDFASIPYTHESDPFENYFQAIIWLVFTLLGRYVRCEVQQARGRADVIIEARDQVYVMELKRDGTAADAIEQVCEKGYASPIAADHRKLHIIGCSFDSKTRKLADWKVA